MSYDKYVIYKDQSYIGDKVFEKYLRMGPI